MKMAGEPCGVSTKKSIAPPALIPKPTLLWLFSFLAVGYLIIRFIVWAIMTLIKK